MKGMIALDIDGTTTALSHGVPEATRSFLASLQGEGWKIAFITGRSYTFAVGALKGLDFPYYLGVQNGATLLDGAQGQVVDAAYLDPHCWRAMDAFDRRFVIYGGYPLGDRCFLKASDFDERWLDYLRRRFQAFGGETLEEVSDFEVLGLPSIASLKCFGERESMEEVSRWMQSHLGLHAPCIRDPFDRQYYVVQGTHPRVHKGKAARHCHELAGGKGPLVVAGDDLNDLPLLNEGEWRIAMATAPEALRKMAHVVAPPAEREGIIEGLSQVLLQMERGKVC